MSGEVHKEPAGRQQSAFALLAAICCVVLGAKLILISAFGSQMPFWDQWDGEAANLYVPYLNGTLSVGDLFASHNEHRIFVTRLLALLHLELAGEWSPKLEMILGAIVHTAIIVWLAALLMPLVSVRRRLLLAGFVMLLFALPIGYENTLWGFESQFYFVALFGIAALVCFAPAPAFSPRWLGGVAFAIVSYFSFSSGTATILVAAVVAMLQLTAGVRERNAREIVGVVLMIVVGIIMIMFVRSTGPRAFDAWRFIQGFIALAALPLATVAGLAFVQGPTAWFVWSTAATRQPRDSRAWIAVGIVGWVAAQMVLFAYGRDFIMGARYFDQVILAYPVALVAVLALADRLQATRIGRFAPPAAAIWVFVMVAVLTTLSYYSSLRAAVEWSDARAQQVINVGAYLASGDLADLAGKVIPYPDPQRLADLLAIPDIQAILPAEIRPTGVDVTGVRERMLLKGVLAEPTAETVRILLLIGPALLALGLGLIFAVATRAALRGGGGEDEIRTHETL